MRGEVRSEADYRQMLADQAASGLSLTEFAKTKGVPYSTLAMWRIRLQGTRREQREGKPPNTSPSKPARRKPQAETPPQPELVPVRLELPTASPANGVAIYGAPDDSGCSVPACA